VRFIGQVADDGAVLSARRPGPTRACLNHPYTVARTHHYVRLSS
jgi:hypothetical protein